MHDTGALVNDLLREVAAAVGLVEGEAGVRDVLAAVARLEPAPTRALSRATGLPVPIVAAVCGELRTRGIVDRARPTRLTGRGRELFGVARPPVPRERAAAELAADADAAPPARSELDQCHCTVETKLRRVEAMEEAGTLAGRRVLLLGDDDLLSLALLRTGLAAALRELAVVDVDPALLAFLGRRLRRAPCAVVRVEHDLREPLPAALAGRFDTVFTDPPYTLAGADLFLARAAAALAPGGGAAVFLAFGPKPPDETVRLQAAIARTGLAIRRLEPNFNEYRGAGIIGGTSHLYHLVSTPATRPLAVGGGPLYTGASRAPRPYRCASCGTVQRVGRGSRWQTVESLRAEGCPECGATRFRPAPPAPR